MEQATSSRRDWAGKSPFEIVQEELEPYVGHNGERLVLTGEEVIVPPSEALSIALAIHQITTNAAKYGALSNDKGKVTVHAGPTSGGLASIEWRETGGPPVTASTSKGFGSFLLEQVLSNDLDATVEMRYKKSGLSCRFDFNTILEGA